MVERTFASWVEPIAAKDRESRAQVVALARSLPGEAWERPSPVEEWMYREILAHLAAGNDKNLQRILRAVVAREPVDASILTRDVDEQNARNVEERRGRSIEELIAEVEADAEELQELFPKLTDADKDLRQGDIPMSLGEGLSNDPGGHFRTHIEQLRTALEERVKR